MNIEPMARAASNRPILGWAWILLCVVGMSGCAAAPPPVAPLSEAETRLATAATSVAEALARTAVALREDTDALDSLAREDLASAGTEGARTLVAGSNHSCIARPSGEVACWGDGQGGALGPYRTI